MRLRRGSGHFGVGCGEDDLVGGRVWVGPAGVFDLTVHSVGDRGHFGLGSISVLAVVEDEVGIAGERFRGGLVG